MGWACAKCRKLSGKHQNSGSRILRFLVLARHHPSAKREGTAVLRQRALLTVSSVVLGGLVGAWATVLLAGALVRHSGTVLAVDAAARTLVVEELAEAGKIRRLQVRVPPEARVVVSTRLPDDQITDLRHPFKDTPIALSEIRPGDFVTIELGGEGGRRAATSVMVTYRR